MHENVGNLQIGNLIQILYDFAFAKANRGFLDEEKKRFQIIIGNIILVEAQAMVIAFLASLVAMVLGWIPDGKWETNHAIILCCGSLLTGAIASGILGKMPFTFFFTLSKTSTAKLKSVSLARHELGEWSVSLFVFYLLQQYKAGLERQHDFDLLQNVSLNLPRYGTAESYHAHRRISVVFFRHESSHIVFAAAVSHRARPMYRHGDVADVSYRRNSPDTYRQYLFIKTRYAIVLHGVFGNPSCQ